MIVVSLPVPALTGVDGLFAFQGMGVYIIHMLTRKRTDIDGTITEDDWCIFRKRECVARIYLEWRTNPFRKEWFWSVLVVPGASGYCETWDEAAAELKAELARRGIE